MSQITLLLTPPLVLPVYVVERTHDGVAIVRADNGYPLGTVSHDAVWTGPGEVCVTDSGVRMVARLIGDGASARVILTTELTGVRRLWECPTARERRALVDSVLRGTGLRRAGRANDDPSGRWVWVYSVAPA